MKIIHVRSNISPEEFLADLTNGVYQVILRSGFGTPFIEMELGLHDALREVIRDDMLVSDDSDNLDVTDYAGAASLISLDSAVDDTPNAIAASGSSSDLPGGNSVAVQLASLQASLVSFSSGDTTFAGFYGNILATIGSDSRSYKNRAEFANEVSRQAETQREQISGVSLEEEQLNLIKYQSAFQAASRLVNVASEILQRLVELGQ